MMSKMLHQAEVRFQQNDQEDGIKDHPGLKQHQKNFFILLLHLHERQKR